MFILIQGKCFTLYACSFPRVPLSIASVICSPVSMQPPVHICILPDLHESPVSFWSLFIFICLALIFPQSASRSIRAFEHQSYSPLQPVTPLGWQMWHPSVRRGMQAQEQWECESSRHTSRLRFSEPPWIHLSAYAGRTKNVRTVQASTIVRIHLILLSSYMSC